MNATAEASTFPDIVSAVDAVMEKRIRVYPCHTNRASAIGDDCERRLVYERVNWREKARHDVGLEYIFEVGRLLEKPVMDMMHAAGFEIIRQQEPFEYKSNGEILLTGHIDGILVDRNGVEYVAEVKSMHPNIWDGVNSEEELNKKPWTRKYIPQLHVYMLGLEIPRAVWILINKSSGRIKQVNTELDYSICEDVLSKCKRINGHVNGGTLPERLEPTPENADICEKCLFKALCAPAINYGEMKLIIDDDLAAQIDEMQGLEEGAKRYNAIKDALKKKFEATGTANATVGKWWFRKKRIWSECWTKLEE